MCWFLLPYESSASGNAHQTISSRPLRLRSHAAGSSTTSCRMRDTARLSTPWPRDWKVEEATMEKPARMKWMLMIRRAGTPMASILSDASKKPSSTPGKSWKIATPRTMIPVA